MLQFLDWRILLAGSASVYAVKDLSTDKYFSYIGIYSINNYSNYDFSFVIDKYGLDFCGELTFLDPLFESHYKNEHFSHIKDLMDYMDKFLNRIDKLIAFI